MVDIPLPAFDVSLSDPKVGELKTDGGKVMGKFTILPGIKVDGVRGSKVTIGGVKPSVTLKEGKSSFGGSVDILKTSFTFKKDEKLGLKASVDVDQLLRYTVKLTGSDTKSKALKFDQSDSTTLEKVKKSIQGSVILREDPLFKDAGMFFPPFTKFKKWVEKVTITVKVTVDKDAGKRRDTSKTATLTRSLEWALRPLFTKDAKPIPPFIPPPDYRDIPPLIAVGTVVCLLICRALKGVQRAEEIVNDLEIELMENTNGIEAVETVLQDAETDIEMTQSLVEEGETELETLGLLEVEVEGELATATTAELVADASEAADWWTIIGGIVSGVAIAAATAALAAAIAKHMDVVEKKKQAQVNLNQNKTELSKQRLRSKKVETTLAHKKDELKAIQDKLKIAKENKEDREDVRDILKAVHTHLENMQKQPKGKKRKLTS